MERRDGDVTIIVPSTDRSDNLSVGDHRHVHELARSLGGRLDVIGHPDSHAGLHVRLPQQRADDPSRDRARQRVAARRVSPCASVNIRSASMRA